MPYSLIRYTIQPGRLEENRALVQAVFAELQRTGPEGLRYLVLELADGEFVHLVATPEDGNSSVLTGSAAFQAFIAGHGDRRTAPIARSEAKVVGEFRMLAATPA